MWARDFLGEEGCLLVMGVSSGAVGRGDCVEEGGHYTIACSECGNTYKGRKVPGGASGSLPRVINQAKDLTIKDFRKVHGEALCKREEAEVCVALLHAALITLRLHSDHTLIAL
jgi:hypothetical protein